MIFFHKVLPLFLSPVTIVIFFILMGLILKRYFLVYLAIFLLLLGSLPIVASGLVKYLEANQACLSLDEMKTADAIVVLGGMLTSVQTTQGVGFEWIDPDRFFKGVELALANKAHYLIFTGGKFPWDKNRISEGDFLYQKALSYGVPRNRILVTKSVQNTGDEAIAVKELFIKHPEAEDKKIILVTSAFHMERAAKLFERGGLKVIPCPVDFKADISGFTPMSFMPNAFALKDTEFSLREIMGRLYYSFF